MYVVPKKRISELLNNIIISLLLLFTEESVQKYGLREAAVTEAAGTDDIYADHLLVNRKIPVSDICIPI